MSSQEDAEMAAAIAAQLAAAKVQCEHPECSAQAVGMIRLGPLMPLLCASHLEICTGDFRDATVIEMKGIIQQYLEDQEYRAAHRGGLSYLEWLAAGMPRPSNPRRMRPRRKKPVDTERS